MDEGRILRDLIVQQDLKQKSVSEITSILDDLINPFSPVKDPIARIHGISDYMLLKKVAKLLFCLKDTSPQQRKKMLSKIESLEGFAHQVGETLLQICNRVIDNRKIKLLGLLFKRVLENELSYNDFLRLNHSCNAFYYDDLLQLTGQSQPLYGHSKMFEFAGMDLVYKSGPKTEKLTPIGIVLVEALKEIHYG